MKKIAFVARGLTKGGTTRFVVNVLKELDQRPDVQLAVFTDQSDTFESQLPDSEVVYIAPAHKLYWDYIKLLLALRKHSLDAIFYPKNIIPFTHILIPARKLNIIHDLAHFVPNLGAYPFWDTLYMKLLMKLSCRIAHRVAAVSEFTKSEIVRVFEVNPNKIAVINEGVEPEFKQITDRSVLDAVIKKYDLALPFMFYCGSISPRKNILRMLQAFAQVQNRMPHHLYLVSGRTWSDHRSQEFINQHPDVRFRTLPFMPTKDLIAMYSLADAYLYPSLYEGFGLPILEAQACGCPAIISNRPPLSDVASDAAYFVNPESVDSIAQAIINLTTNEKLKQSLVEKGLRNVQRFSWSATAARLLELAVAKPLDQE